MRVKACVLVFIVFSLYALVKSQSASDVAAYKDKQEACIKELNIAATEAAQIASEKEVSNPSDAYKCYHNCLYKKLGLLSADGKPKNEALLKFAQMRFLKAPLDKIKSQFSSCAASTKKDGSSCDFVRNYEVCMVKALKA